jgi:protein gp37
MAENSKIEWTDHTHNHWTGCTKISPACDHCYAEGWAKRTGNGALWEGQRRLTTEANRRKPLIWNREAGENGIRYRVFCSSLADVFDNQVPSEWREDLFRLIRATPHLDWLLLTKRPPNIAKMLPPDWGNGWHNVWLGVSTENREEMLRRGKALKAIPAVVHFWSAEPLLEDLGPIPADIMPSWIITGGESGPGARPMHPDWARSLRDQCAAHGMSFFFKQWGEWFPECQWEHNPYLALPTSKGIWHIEQLPLHAVGKARAGRLLDGVEHNEFPTRNVRWGDV